MDNQWKNETCGTCDFVVEWEEDTEGQCRKNPPLQINANVANHYSYVHKTNPACSCWRGNYHEQARSIDEMPF